MENNDLANNYRALNSDHGEEYRSLAYLYMTGPGREHANVERDMEYAGLNSEAPIGDGDQLACQIVIMFRWIGEGSPEVDYDVIGGIWVVGHVALVTRPRVNWLFIQRR